MNQDARQLMAEYAFREARRVLAGELRKNPGDWTARLRYGICSLMLGKTRVFLKIHREAEAFFEKNRIADRELARLATRYAALAVAVAALTVTLPGCKKDDGDEFQPYTTRNNTRVIEIKYGVVVDPPVMKYAVWPFPGDPGYTPKYGVRIDLPTPADPPVGKP